MYNVAQCKIVILRDWTFLTQGHTLNNLRKGPTWCYKLNKKAMGIVVSDKVI